ncbi:hypothetical protein niasHT_026555 [Heterodera trifolii]|uniref:Uncharacterized protein n=1 Tax=Heterodera trifolii TaxID=157864 RepID=A0ABD2KS63_9BILA
MRTKFDELRKKMEQKLPKLADFDLCKLWDFEEIILQINRELQFATKPNHGKLLLETRVELEKKYKCKELESEIIPFWAATFKLKLSEKHLVYLGGKLSLDSSQMGQVGLWFGNDRMANESELSHRLRTLSRNSEFDKLKAVKTLMELFLMQNSDIGILVVRYPLTLSAGE